MISSCFSYFIFWSSFNFILMIYGNIKIHFSVSLSLHFSIISFSFSFNLSISSSFSNAIPLGIGGFAFNSSIWSRSFSISIWVLSCYLINVIKICWNHFLLLNICILFPTLYIENKCFAVDLLLSLNLDLCSS